MAIIDRLSTGTRNQFVVGALEVEVVPSEFWGSRHLTFKIFIAERPVTIDSFSVDNQKLEECKDFFYHRGSLYFSPKAFQGKEITGLLGFSKDGGQFNYKFRLTRANDLATCLRALEQQVVNYKSMADDIERKAREDSKSQTTILYMKNALDDYMWNERIAALDYIEENFPPDNYDFIAKVNNIGKITIV